jgi:hypothetical protein
VRDGIADAHMQNQRAGVARLIERPIPLDATAMISCGRYAEGGENVVVVGFPAAPPLRGKRTCSG